MARDPERRWTEAREHLLYQVNAYARWFAEASGAEPHRAEGDEALRAGGIRILTPEQAVDAIREYVATTGVSRFYSWTLPPGLPPEWSDEHVELMAREVIPAFR